MSGDWVRGGWAAGERPPQVRVWWAVGAWSLSIEQEAQKCLRRGLQGLTWRLVAGRTGGRPEPGRRPQGV